MCCHPMMIIGVRGQESDTLKVKFSGVRHPKGKVFRSHHVATFDSMYIHNVVRAPFTNEPKKIDVATSQIDASFK